MERIVKDIIEGKSGAVAKFYKEYSVVIKRYLQGKIGLDEDVQELLQDVFMSAIDSISLYRGESSVKTWILSIARHEVADFYRKRYVRKLIEKTSPLFDEIVAELSSPEFEMKKKGIKNRFFKAYRSLSKEYQDVLSYRYELGMSVKETAARMELSLKATESLIYRARMAFRYAYENSEE